METRLLSEQIVDGNAGFALGLQWLQLQSSVCLHLLALTFHKSICHMQEHVWEAIYLTLAWISRSQFCLLTFELREFAVCECKGQLMIKIILKQVKLSARNRLWLLTWNVTIWKNILWPFSQFLFALFLISLMSGTNKWDIKEISYWILLSYEPVCFIFLRHCKTQTGNDSEIIVFLSELLNLLKIVLELMHNLAALSCGEHNRYLCVFTREQTPSSVGSELLQPPRKQGVDRWKLIEFPNFPFRGLKCSSARDPYHIETGAGRRPGTYACCGQHSQRDQQHAPFSRLTPDILWHDSSALSLQAVRISACWRSPDQHENTYLVVCGFDQSDAFIQSEQQTSWNSLCCYAADFWVLLTSIPEVNISNAF